MKSKIEDAYLKKPTTAKRAVARDAVSKKTRALGLCLGASTITLVHLEQAVETDGLNPGTLPVPPRVAGGGPPGRPYCRRVGQRAVRV